MEMEEVAKKNLVFYYIYFCTVFFFIKGIYFCNTCRIFLNNRENNSPRIFPFFYMVRAYWIEILESWVKELLNGKQALEVGEYVLWQKNLKFNII